jgi:hypothetical protein
MERPSFLKGLFGRKQSEAQRENGAQSLSPHVRYDDPERLQIQDEMLKKEKLITPRAEYEKGDLEVRIRDILTTIVNNLEISRAAPPSLDDTALSVDHPYTLSKLNEVISQHFSKLPNEHELRRSLADRRVFHNAVSIAKEPSFMNGDFARLVRRLHATEDYEAMNEAAEQLVKQLPELVKQAAKP